MICSGCSGTPGSDRVEAGRGGHDMAQRSRQEGPRARSRPAPGSRLALLGCVLALAVVALGAFTRLVDAGLGCPGWPGCYGHLLWPRAAHEVVEANAVLASMAGVPDTTR